MGAGSSTEASALQTANRLCDEFIAPQDVKFWDELCNTPTNAEDVWNVFTLDLLRRVLYAQPLNLCTLFKGLLLRIHSIVNIQSILQTNNKDSELNKDTLVKAGTLSAAARLHVENNTRLLLNCIRLLTRIVSVLHETEDDEDAEALKTPVEVLRQRIEIKNNFNQFVWGHEYPGAIHIAQQNQNTTTAAINEMTEAATKTTTRSLPESSSQSTSNDSAVNASPEHTVNDSALDTNISAVTSFTPSAQSMPADWFVGQLYNEVLGVLMMKLLTECLFLESFTIATPSLSAVNAAGIHLGKLWELNSEAIGLSHTQQAFHIQFSQQVTAAQRFHYDLHRCEVLRCLLVSVCGAMFVRVEQFVPYVNPFIEALTNWKVNPLSLTLFYSLLNTVLQMETTSASTLFYGNSNTSEMRRSLIELSLQAILVVLDCYELPSEEGNETVDGDGPAATTEEQRPSLSESEGEIEHVILSPGMAALKAKYNEQQLQLHEQQQQPSDQQQEVKSEDSNSSLPSNTSSIESSASTSPNRIDCQSSVASRSGKKVTFAADPNKPKSPKVEIINQTHTQQTTHYSTQTDFTRQNHAEQDEHDVNELNEEPPTFFNCWTFTLSHLQGRSLTQLYQHLTRLLLYSMTASQSLLSSTPKPLECIAEVYILLWKCLDYNPVYMQHILTHQHECSIYSLLTTLFFHIYNTRLDSASQGLMYTCVFILLRLSGARDFAIQLNQVYPFTDSISGGSNPAQPATPIPLTQINLLQILNIQPLLKQLPPSADATLTYGDLLILICHALIMSDNNEMDALLKVLLTQLNNVSPYLTRLSILSSVKLIQLFEHFSSQQFMLQSKLHITYLHLLLSMFNNLLHYQAAGCAHLIYGIVRRSSLFYELTRPHTAEAVKSPSLSGDASEATVSVEWLNEEKSRLPLEIILRLLDFFLPLISRFVSHHGVQRDETGLIELIRASPLVGVLPVPGPVVVRKYMSNQQTNHWFSTFLFGLIFLRNQHLPTLFQRQAIKLFVVATQQDENIEALLAGTAEQE